MSASEMSLIGDELNDLRRQVKRLHDEVDGCVTAIESLRAERNAMRERLHETAQILIEEVGADGPTNAEDAARMAVARMERLRELADEKAHEAGLYARRMGEAQEARNKARGDERALVVAWLRRRTALRHYADCIERGEHHDRLEEEP